MMYRKLDIHMQENEIGYVPYIIYKNLIKIFKYLKVVSGPVQLVDENIGGKLFDTDLVNDFLDMTPKVQATKTKINKQGYSKVESTTKKKINKIKGKPTEWKKILNPLSHRWQTQGPLAESGPPPCFILPSTLFLPGGSAKLLIVK